MSLQDAEINLDAARSSVRHIGSQAGVLEIRQPDREASGLLLVWFRPAALADFPKNRAYPYVKLVKLKRAI